MAEIRKKGELKQARDSTTRPHVWKSRQEIPHFFASKCHKIQTHDVVGIVGTPHGTVDHIMQVVHIY